MGFGALLVVIVLGALVAWKLGSVALRILGVLCFAVGLAGLAGGENIATSVFVAILGIVLWLAGHWLFAFRHHAYRSTLAQRLFLTAFPRWMDPTRNWGIRTIDDGD
jgi:hypothetical protein